MCAEAGDGAPILRGKSRLDVVERLPRECGVLEIDGHVSLDLAPSADASPDRGVRAS
jgi:hypothetical protein